MGFPRLTVIRCFILARRLKHAYYDDENITRQPPFQARTLPAWARVIHADAGIDEGVNGREIDVSCAATTIAYLLIIFA